MTREQAINYLFSCGFTNEQVGEVVRALTYEPTTKNNLGVDCISRESVLELLNDYRDKHFENRKEYPVNYGTLLDILRWIRNLPSVTPQLSVPEVTALAEWTEKLTKASEDAYNKGYEAGMKELKPITTKDKFEYALTACGCLLKDGKTWYEHNELIECFENLGLLENPHAKNKESMTREEAKEFIAQSVKSDVDMAKVADALNVLEQEPKTGHWINTANPRMSDNIVCSECGYDSIADYKFCPNCGAKMKSEVDNGKA
jgi:hypothetical protein